MQGYKGIGSLFPGSTAANIIVLGMGIVLVVCAWLPGATGLSITVLSGLGSAMFIAGFLGLINVRVLANEVSKVTKQPFEDMVLLAQIKGAGMQWISRERNEMLQEKIIPAVDQEFNEAVILGSSLKGLIGVGYSTVGQAQRTRDTLIKALRRGVKINILMTSPTIAHHRSKQEGRIDGDIEAEILENLMYLTKLKHDNPDISPELKIGLYEGTPTIFMLCLSSLMMINPYPYYSTAHGSFSFLIKSESALYRGYYESHYRAAWTDTKMTMHISENIALAINQIKALIEGFNAHGRKIIPDVNKEKDLLEKLKRIE